jgi:2-polyprenyl-3-methyl-5-hydroxy-6-metoxy-1,4-benzoquinol methylase
MVQFIEDGSVFENIKKLAESSEKYDLILLDNVLEHVYDPEELIHILL